MVWGGHTPTPLGKLRFFFFRLAFHKKGLNSLQKNVQDTMPNGPKNYCERLKELFQMVLKICGKKETKKCFVGQIPKHPKLGILSFSFFFTWTFSLVPWSLPPAKSNGGDNDDADAQYMGIHRVGVIWSIWSLQSYPNFGFLSIIFGRENVIIETNRKLFCG